MHGRHSRSKWVHAPWLSVLSGRTTLRIRTYTMLGLQPADPSIELKNFAMDLTMKPVQFLINSHHTFGQQLNLVAQVFHYDAGLPVQLLGVSR